MHNTNKDQMKIGLLLASPKTQRIPTTLAAIKIEEAKKIKMVLAIAKILTVWMPCQYGGRLCVRIIIKLEM